MKRQWLCGYMREKGKQYPYRLLFTGLFQFHDIIFSRQKQGQNHVSAFRVCFLSASSLLKADGLACLSMRTAYHIFQVSHF